MSRHRNQCKAGKHADLPEPPDQRLFHHTFASLGVAFFCLIATLLYQAGVLALSWQVLLSLLLVFTVVNVCFTLTFFWPLGDRVKRDYLVLLHMLWGQGSLLVLAYFSPQAIEVAMMLSLATFGLVAFSMASVKLGLSVVFVIAGFGWIFQQHFMGPSWHVHVIAWLAYSVSAVFIAFINAYSGNLQMFLERQNSVIRERTAQLEQSQQALVEAKNAAEHLAQSKTRFLAAASHDLRQPLHALSLYVGAMPNQKTDADRQHVMQQMQKSSHELNQLLDALFDISRFDTEMATVNLQAVGVADIVSGLQSEFQELAEREGRALTLRARRVWVESDPILLQRIIRSLVSNALRHAGKGRVLLGFRVREDWVRCEVWDSGAGIRYEDQHKIFEEFYQVHNHSRNRSRGLGLGLALVKRICLSVGHELGMRSEPGRGSVFWFDMPRLVAPAGASRGVTMSASESKAGSLDGVTLVCVEDEMAILGAMQSLFHEWGAFALCASSGERIIKKLRLSRASPQVIICDYRLAGGMDGLTLITQIRRELQQAVPAILLTGDINVESDSALHTEGISVVKKPLCGEALHRHICDALAMPAISVPTRIT